MLSMLHNILKKGSLVKSGFIAGFICLFFSISALATKSELLEGKKIDLSYQNSSSKNYYSKIQLFPTNDVNNPPCNITTTGMMAVDTFGILYICNGSFWETATSPWDIDPTGKIVFPLDFPNTRVAIGNNTIPANPPVDKSALVQFYVSQPQPDNATALNQIEFIPSDANQNVGIEMYTGGIPSGGLRTSNFINFLVGDRGNPWDARIEYFYDGTLASGLKFIAQRKNLSQPANAYPEMTIYSNGNVDFGSNEDLGLPARNQGMRVKVYGNTKADSLILEHSPNPANPLRVQFDPTGTGGYYAVYTP